MAGRREREHESIHAAVIKECIFRLTSGHALPPQETRDIAGQCGHYHADLSPDHFLSFSNTVRNQQLLGDEPVLLHQVTKKTFVIRSANIPPEDTDVEEVVRNLRDSIRAANTRGAIARSPSTPCR